VLLGLVALLAGDVEASLLLDERVSLLIEFFADFFVVLGASSLAIDDQLRVALRVLQVLRKKLLVDFGASFLLRLLDDGLHAKAAIGVSRPEVKLEVGDHRLSTLLLSEVLDVLLFCFVVTAASSLVHKVVFHGRLHVQLANFGLPVQFPLSHGTIWATVDRIDLDFFIHCLRSVRLLLPPV